MCCLQRGSVRVDSVEDFAYGSEILINTMDKVRKALVAQHVGFHSTFLAGEAETFCNKE